MLRFIIFGSKGKYAPHFAYNRLICIKNCIKLNEIELYKQYAYEGCAIK
jgi:hypothetical protein